MYDPNVDYGRYVDLSIAPSGTFHPEPIHGTPITPKALLPQLRGRSFCVSFQDPRDLDTCIELVGKNGILLLDNGAFTAWTSGKSKDPAYWDGYYEWARAAMERCPQAVAVAPDVIEGGTVEDNYELMLDAMYELDSDRLMVVWHLHEPLSFLTALCERFQFIAWGSSGEYAKIGTPAWKKRIAEAFKAVREWEQSDAGHRAGYVTPRTHMMRALGQLHEYLWDSADSTNIARNHCVYKHQPHHVSAFAARIERKVAAAWR